MTQTFSRSFAFILSAALVTTLWAQTLSIPTDQSRQTTTTAIA